MKFVFCNIQITDKITHFEPHSAGLNSKYITFLLKKLDIKTMKYKKSDQKLAFPQNEENALMAFMYSTDNHYCLSVWNLRKGNVVLIWKFEVQK